MTGIRTPVQSSRRRIVYLSAALAGVAAGLAIGLAAHAIPGRSGGAPEPPGMTSCAIPAWVHADGKVLAAGSCAALLLGSAQTVTVQAGQQINVDMLQEQTPQGSVPLYPLPRSTDSWVLARTFASSAQATATYTAMHPGRAVLVTKADCLPAGTLRSQVRNCPVIDVTVIPRPPIPGTAADRPGSSASVWPWWDHR
jgi:hypothetical protein